MSDINFTEVINEVELDMEWLELLKEAVDMGLTAEDIRDFFTSGKKV